MIVHHDQDTAFYAERRARDNPWIESLWGHFEVENRSLLSEAATLEELEWVIDRQRLYYNSERRRLGA